MKVMIMFLFILTLSLGGCFQNNWDNLNTVSTTDITEEHFKRPLTSYFEESRPSDSNDNIEIYYYKNIPNNVADKYRNFLESLNIEDEIIQGKDGVGYKYEYLLPTRKWVSIHVISSVVTGNRISLKFESPIVD